MFSYRKSSQFQLSQELLGGGDGSASIHGSTSYHANLSASSTTLQLLDTYNSSTGSNFTFSPHDQNLLIIYHLKMLKALAVGLQLPHEVCVSAMMYMRRFYAKNTIHICDPLILVPTTLLLASKIEEYPINAQTILAQWGTNANVGIGSGDSTSESYGVQDVLDVEKYLMGELGFQMMAYHPFGSLGAFVHDMENGSGHTPLLNLWKHHNKKHESAPTQNNHTTSQQTSPNTTITASSTSSLNGSSRNTCSQPKNSPIDEAARLYQYAWNILNDSYFSDVIILYPPSMLALASIYMTAIIFESDFEANFGARVKQWFEGLNLPMRPIGEISDKLLALYESLQSFDRDVSLPLLNLRRWVSSGHRFIDTSRSPGFNTISPHISPPTGGSSNTGTTGAYGDRRTGGGGTMHRMAHRR
uniref:Cyclin N-terminal domain-containing protein n=1 Tax=Percolomonas cosmopolitus TaxID=63605 RepID=A0A7S1KP12_9EUKA